MAGAGSVTGIRWGRWSPSSARSIVAHSKNLRRVCRCGTEKSGRKPLSMLGTLRKIVQEVNAAKDLKAALGIIVLRVREAMGSQVCSVYLLDPETERFVLMATEGLNKRSIGKVSMAPNEGLVGLVGTREEPLNLENAADHPRYRYFAETGEERYASFLGAPIIHHRRV